MKTLEMHKNSYKYNKNYFYESCNISKALLASLAVWLSGIYVCKDSKYWQAYYYWEITVLSKRLPAHPCAYLVSAISSELILWKKQI